MKTMNLQCIHQILSHQFYRLGTLIARHPFVFFLLPLLTSGLLSLGMLKLVYNRNIDYLFTARNGKAYNNKVMVEKYFPVNTSVYADATRMTNSKDIILGIVAAKDGKSILRRNTFQEIIALDQVIKNVTIESNGKLWNFNNLCAKQRGKCTESNFLKLEPSIKDIERNIYKRKYPFSFNNMSFTYEEYVFSLGGVELTDGGYIKDAKAVRLGYFMDVSDVNKHEAIKQWQNSVKTKLKFINFENISLSFFTFDDIEEKYEELTERLVSRIPIVIALLVLFSFFTCMTNDWIRSKPWLGPSACISAGLAIASGFGFVCLLNVEYVDFNLGVCFFILGSEIDDAFVLISAWRRTSHKGSVEERLGRTFHEVGVSITVTSFTNFVSFSIGTTIKFPIIRIICIYATVCIVFTYLYLITFFGACMAFSGYREEKKLHPFTLQLVKDKNTAEETSSSPDANGVSNIQEEYIMTLFRDKVGYLLSFATVRIIIFVLFLGNIALGTWGLLTIRSGNDVSDVIGDDSSLAKLYEEQYKYFDKFYHPLHIIINEPLNYADEKVQINIENMLQKFENHPHVSDVSVRLSWLDYYKFFARFAIGKFLLRGYDLSKSQDFMDGLRTVFLRFPQAVEFNEDIRFNEDFTNITASRFILLIKDISGPDIEIEVLKDLYRIAESFKFPVKVHSLTFHNLEQAILIKDITYQTALVCAGLIFIAFFIFIPNIVCSFCVSSIVLCIIFETIGFSSFFNIKVDILLLGCIIICIGFSINYPTHITFSFVMGKGLSSEERIRKSIYEIGWPIFQGSLSTILGVSVLAFEPYYIPIGIFKLASILSIQTAIHALFVIPIVLTVVGYCDKSLLKKTHCSKKEKLSNSNGEESVMLKL